MNNHNNQEAQNNQNVMNMNDDPLDGDGVDEEEEGEE